MEITFDDGNAERVDTLGYAWQTVTQQSRDAQDKLLEVQPIFKADLLSGVAQLLEDMDEFERDYVERFEFTIFNSSTLSDFRRQITWRFC